MNKWSRWKIIIYCNLLCIFYKRWHYLLCFSNICFVFVLLFLTFRFWYVKLIGNLAAYLGSFNKISLFIFQGRLVLGLRFDLDTLMILMTVFLNQTWYFGQLQNNLSKNLSPRMTYIFSIWKGGSTPTLSYWKNKHLH